jgi:hypothetical protein
MILKGRIYGGSEDEVKEFDVISILYLNVF